MPPKQIAAASKIVPFSLVNVSQDSSDQQQIGKTWGSNNIQAGILIPFTSHPHWLYWTSLWLSELKAAAGGFVLRDLFPVINRDLQTKEMGAVKTARYAASCLWSVLDLSKPWGFPDSSLTLEGNKVGGSSLISLFKVNRVQAACKCLSNPVIFLVFISEH